MLWVRYLCSGGPVRGRSVESENLPGFPCEDVAAWTVTKQAVLLSCGNGSFFLLPDSLLFSTCWSTSNSFQGVRSSLQQGPELPASTS